MKKVAIIGTVGVPANYGGFETLVENMLGENCSAGIEYTVFCSARDCAQTLSEYKGARLRYVPLRANGVQSIFYDGLSLLRSLWGYDVVLVLGVSGGIFFPFFRLLSRCRFIVNIDGLEWKRDKWGAAARFILRFSEWLAVRLADVVVADNQGIVNHVQAEYGRGSELIAYGADHVQRDVSAEQTSAVLSQYGLEEGGYAMSLCRIEPENNCELILEAFSRCSIPLIFIGNWAKSEYGRGLKAKYAGYAHLHLIDAVYDLDVLHVLRSCCQVYVHGHSAGGTNPSLVEAMYCGCNLFAFDVVYNRETTEDRALYFSDVHQLMCLICELAVNDSNASAMLEIARRRYTWAIVAKQYEALYGSEQ